MENRSKGQAESISPAHPPATHLTFPIHAIDSSSSAGSSPFASPTSIAATRGTMTPLLSPVPTSTAATSPPTSSSDGLQSGGSLRSMSSSTSHGAAGKASGAVSARPPTLSDIAARMHLDGVESPDSTSSSLYGSHLDATAPLKGRLGLAGRLNSSSSELTAAAGDTDNDKVQVTTATPLSRAASPGQPPTSSAPPPSGEKTSPNPNGKGKTLPTLDEIRERLNKKGHSAALPTSSSTPALPLVTPATVEAFPSTTAGSIAVVKAPSPTRPPSESRDAGGSTSPTAAIFSRSPEKKTGWPLPANPTPMLPPTSTKPLSTANWRGNAPPSRVPPPNHPLGTHPLQHEWTLYYDSKQLPTATNAPEGQADHPAHTSNPPKGASTTETWEAALKKVGEYHTVESFMSVFGGIKRPSTLERNSNYHLFKNGIKPMWEDPANAKGGKWVLTFDRKGSNPALVDRSWIWLVLAMIGEELDLNDEVTGAVLSTRPKFDRIALWIRGKEDVKQVNRIGRKLVDLLEVEKESGVALEFSSNSTGSHHRGGPHGSQSYLGFNNGAFSSSIPASGGPPTSSSTNSARGTTPHTSAQPATRLGNRRGSSGIGSTGFGAGGLLGRANVAPVGGGGMVGRAQASTLTGKR